MLVCAHFSIFSSCVRHWMFQWNRSGSVTTRASLLPLTECVAELIFINAVSRKIKLSDDSSTPFQSTQFRRCEIEIGRLPFPRNVIFNFAWSRRQINIRQISGAFFVFMLNFYAPCFGGWWKMIFFQLPPLLCETCKMHLIEKVGSGQRRVEEAFYSDSLHAW